MGAAIITEILQEPITTLIATGIAVLTAYLRVVAARLDRKVDENTELTREISNGQRAENKELREELIDAMLEIERLRTKLQRYRAKEGTDANTE